MGWCRATPDLLAHVGGTIAPEGDVGGYRIDEVGGGHSATAPRPDSPVLDGQSNVILKAGGDIRIGAEINGQAK